MKPLCLSELIEIDTHYLNFGTFYSGKIFKCALRIKNLSKEKRTLKIYFNDETIEFTKKLLISEFSHLIEADTLKSLLATSETIFNTENSYKCWYLMVPPLKSFEKSLKLALVPDEEIEIGVVIRSPQIGYCKQFFSILNVRLHSEDPYGESRESFKVLNMANLDIPKLECTKQLICLENGIKIIPLVIRFENNGIERIRIPFKNNGKKELELILAVVPYPNGEANLEEGKINITCTPNSCKMSPNSIGIVTLTIIRCDKQLIQCNKRQQKVSIIKV